MTGIDMGPFLILGLAAMVALPTSASLPAPADTTWFVYQVDPASDPEIHYTDFGMDALGIPHIVYTRCCHTDWPPTALSSYARWAGEGTWTISTPIEFPDVYLFAENPRILLDSSGSPRFYQARHEEYSPAAAYLYEILPPSPSLAVYSLSTLDGPFDMIEGLAAAQGTSVRGLAYEALLPGEPLPEWMEIRFVENSAGSWSEPVVLWRGNVYREGMVFSLDLAYDSDQPHVVYSLGGGTSSVYDATRVDGVWTTARVNTPGDAYPEGYHPADTVAAQASGGVLHVLETVYQDQLNSTVLYVRVDAAGTTVEELAGDAVSTAYHGRVTELELGAGGRPHVLYLRSQFYESGYNGLRLLHREDAGWVEDALPQEVSGFAYPFSMEVGPDNAVRIAFVGGQAGSGLWFASQVPLPTYVPIPYTLAVIRSPIAASPAPGNPAPSLGTGRWVGPQGW